jgi:hypothetical protein
MNSRNLAMLIAIGVILLIGGTEKPLRAEEGHGEAVEADASGLRLSRYGNWIFRSCLRDESDDATTLGLELESKLSLKSLEIKNISYFEVAQYDRGVPGQPAGNPDRGYRGCGEEGVEQARCGQSRRQGRAEKAAESQACDLPQTAKERIAVIGQDKTNERSRN